MAELGSKYRTYPEYKDSGVEWLGEIPKCWEKGKLKYILSIFNGKDYKHVESEEGIPVYGSGGIFKYATDYLFEGDSILYGRKGTIDKPLLVSGKFWTVDTMFYSQVSLNFNIEFIYYYSLIFPYTLLSTSTALPSMTQEDLLNLCVVYPNRVGQNLIVKFLDHETAKIDQLIEKQQKLIKLLEEKRQAMISHAVTKGLDPNVKMKDSGVEWLGEVPKHWETQKFKYIFTIQKRIAGRLGFDVLSITQRGIVIRDIESGEGQLSMDYSKYQLVNKGDFAMNQMDLLTGFVDISKYDGVTSPDYRVFTLEQKNSTPQYYLYLLQMCYLEKIFFPLGQGAAHIGRWRLPTKEFNNFIAPLPPLSEQKNIVSYVTQFLDRYKELTQRAKEQIDLLKERRTALISAAVTGKIDVRDWEMPES